MPRHARMPRRSRLALLLSALLLPAALGLTGSPALAAVVPGVTVHSFDFSPRSVDVTSEPAVVTVTTRVSDATSWGRSGRDDEYLYFGFKSGVGYQGMATARDAVILKRVSGDAGDGVYSGTYTVDRYAAPGTWKVFFHQSRNGGGVVLDPPAGSPTSLTVVSGNPDLEAPVASEPSVTPSTVDLTCGSQKVTVRARLTDRSGVREPGNHQFSIRRAGAGMFDDHAAGGYMTKVSGTATDGIWTGTLTVDAKAANGSWDLVAGAYDVLNNGKSVSQKEIDAAKQRGVFTITRSGGACAAPKEIVPSIVFSSGDRTSIVMPPYSGPGGRGPVVKFRGAPGETLRIFTKTANTPYTQVGTLTLIDKASGSPVALHGGTFPYQRYTTSMIVKNAKGVSSKPITVQVESWLTTQVKMTDAKTRRTQFSGKVTPALNGRVVTVYNNGKSYGTAKTNAAGAWSFVRNVAPGRYSFQAKTATDAFNLGDVSDTWPITVS